MNRNGKREDRGSHKHVGARRWRSGGTGRGGGGYNAVAPAARMKPSERWRRAGSGGGRPGRSPQAGAPRVARAGCWGWMGGGAPVSRRAWRRGCGETEAASHGLARGDAGGGGRAAALVRFCLGSVVGCWMMSGPDQKGIYVGRVDSPIRLRTWPIQTTILIIRHKTEDNNLVV